MNTCNTGFPTGDRQAEWKVGATGLRCTAGGSHRLIRLMTCDCTGFRNDLKGRLPDHCSLSRIAKNQNLN